VVQLAPLDNWPAFRQVVQLAEALGFDSYWTYDHPTGGSESWTTLAAVAESTAKMRLGTLTSCIFYRSPALLARAAADVDRISQGRLVLGLGIGDAEAEFTALGIPWLSVRERQQALEEAIQIVWGLWGEQPFTYQGKHFQVAEATGAPGPMQQPHVPLLIAGGGERVTLRQVAQYADVSNFGAHAWAGGAFTPEDVRRKYDALRGHCQAVGRPYEAILRTYADFPVILADTPDAVQAKLAAIPTEDQAFYQTSTLAATTAEAIAHYRGLAAAGVQYFIVALWGHDVETLRLLGEQVMPAVSANNVSADPSYVRAPNLTAAPVGSDAQRASTKRRWWPWRR
jgi:alkanesulfonate monooxygenase SsuD/methylene tetrahydromethanopterin reductase-like flavin-dependent oxidoreductase (luciferase family)